MKLFFAITFLFSVVCGEFCTMMESYSTEISHMETAFEGEVEKDAKESAEDFSEAKIRQVLSCIDLFSIQDEKALLDEWTISMPYLEITCPPPEIH
ncbi:MAG: hypothetical protein AAGA77_20090 [Bacteroidota bacterium]